MCNTDNSTIRNCPAIVDYATAIAWIAHNDAPGDALTARQLMDTVSVRMVADIFGRGYAETAINVFNYRKRYM